MADAGHPSQGQLTSPEELAATAHSACYAMTLALLQIDGGMSMRELATRLGGHASNATGIADRLAARGLVERHEDADDRRVKRVDLTPEGAATRKQLVACMESARTPFARLSAAQRRQLHDLLLAAIEPDTDLREAQRQAARLLGSIELD